MSGALSLPVLLALAWGIAGLLWWDRRRNVVRAFQLPWMILAMALVGVAMVLALVAVPGTRDEQLVRVALLLEAVYGLGVMTRKLLEARRDRR